jgi:hypothetical protein
MKLVGAFTHLVSTLILSNLPQANGYEQKKPLDRKNEELQKQNRFTPNEEIPLHTSEKQKDQQTSLRPVQSLTHHGQSSEHVK